MTIDKLMTFGNALRTCDNGDKYDLAKQIGTLIDRLVRDMKCGDGFTPEERAELIAYILEYYKDLSIADLKKAIDLTIIQGFGDAVDYSTYGRFSSQYVCRMLNEYRKYKANENMKKPALQAHHKALPISEQANKKTRMQIAETTYADYVATGRFHLLNVDSVFSEMEIAGLTTDYETLKPMYIQRANLQIGSKEKTEVKSDEVRTKTGNLLADLIFTKIPALDSEIDDNVLNQAKRLYLRDRFEFWKNNKRERVFL